MALFNVLLITSLSTIMAVRMSMRANRTSSHTFQPSCADELEGQYKFMKQVGAADHTVFYVYGKVFAENHHQFFVFSSEPGSGKFGAKAGSVKRHLNYFIVKGEQCVVPSDKDCITNKALFPGQETTKGGNKPGAGWMMVIGWQGMTSMKNTYDGSQFGLGNLHFSLVSNGMKMIATTEDGCAVGRVNVCSEKKGKPSVVDVYDQSGKFCKTIVM